MAKFKKFKFKIQYGKIGLNSLKKVSKTVIANSDFICNWNFTGCEDCMTTYSHECPTHKLVSIPDKVVLSRAWASLPPMLQIYRLPENAAYPNGMYGNN